MRATASTAAHASRNHNREYEGWWLNESNNETNALLGEIAEARRTCRTAFLYACTGALSALLALAAFAASRSACRSSKDEDRGCHRVRKAHPVYQHAAVGCTFRPHASPAFNGTKPVRFCC